MSGGPPAGHRVQPACDERPCISSRQRTLRRPSLRHSQRPSASENAAHAAALAGADRDARLDPDALALCAECEGAVHLARCDLGLARPEALLAMPGTAFGIIRRAMAERRSSARSRPMTSAGSRATASRPVRCHAGRDAPCAMRNPTCSPGSGAACVRRSTTSSFASPAPPPRCAGTHHAAQ